MCVYFWLVNNRVKYLFCAYIYILFALIRYVWGWKSLVSSICKPMAFVRECAHARQTFELLITSIHSIKLTAKADADSCHRDCHFIGSAGVPSHTQLSHWKGTFLIDTFRCDWFVIFGRFQCGIFRLGDSVSWRNRCEAAYHHFSSKDPTHTHTHSKWKTAL